MWYLLIWVDYYAHSTSLHTICISKVKSIFVTYIQKNIVQHKVNISYITHRSISYITVVNRHYTLNQKSKSNSGTITYRSKSISVTYKEVQSFFFKFWRKNIYLFIVWYILIWVDYYAYSTSRCTIVFSEGKSVFVTCIQKNIVDVCSKYVIITHSGAFLTLLSLIGTAS